VKNWKKIKAKEKNYFCEIRAKKVRLKMDQQRNGKRQKRPQQNKPRQKDVLPIVIATQVNLILIRL